VSVTHIDEALRVRARAHADRAAAGAGVVVRELLTQDEFDAARLVWDTVWPMPGGGTEVTSHFLRALHHSGAYVSGAYSGEDIIGACLAVVARSQDPDGSWHTHLHSHVAAALPGRADRGLGTALKVHQRSWALDRDLDRIEWTFDPLVRRNARLNLVKLGGLAVRYHVDFYGAMTDGINEGDASDRFILHWDIASERVQAAMDGPLEVPTRDSLVAAGAAVAVSADGSGGPRVHDVDAPVILVALPEDVVALRVSDRALAARWRAAVRGAVEPVVNAGGRVVGQTVEGDYVVEVGS
jgi:predicted GNAT superfamily acetyltransferase